MPGERCVQSATRVTQPGPLGACCGTPRKNSSSKSKKSARFSRAGAPNLVGRNALGTFIEKRASAPPSRYELANVFVETAEGTIASSLLPRPRRVTVGSRAASPTRGPASSLPARFPGE